VIVTFPTKLKILMYAWCRFVSHFINKYVFLFMNVNLRHLIVESQQSVPLKFDRVRN